MLKTNPRVQESEDAKDFEYKEGALEISNLNFKHYNTPDEKKNKDKKDDEKVKEVEEKVLLDNFSLKI